MERTTTEAPQHNLFLRDINEVTYLELNNVKTKAVKLGTRVNWECEATDEVYRLLRAYSANPTVKILDYITVLRRLRSEMYGLRESRISDERG
jgi:hypothetical protein